MMTHWTVFWLQLPVLVVVGNLSPCHTFQYHIFASCASHHHWIEQSQFCAGNCCQKPVLAICARKLSV